MGGHILENDKPQSVYLEGFCFIGSHKREELSKIRIQNFLTYLQNCCDLLEIFVSWMKVLVNDLVWNTSRRKDLHVLHSKQKQMN
jgi:hypothetical protein